MSHTPGPWKTDGVVVFDKPGNVVAYVVDQANARELGVRTEVWEERTDNAALIAAAPEMLAAWKLLLEAGKEVSDTDGSDGSKAKLMRAVRMAVSAVAKAEGRQ